METIWKFARLEHKLILRNRRPLMLVLIGLVFSLSYCFTFITEEKVGSDSLLLLLPFLLLFSGYIFYAQLNVAWESSYFGLLLNLPCLREFLLAKHINYCLYCAIMGFVAFYFISVFADLLVYVFAAATYSMGVNSFIVLYFSLFNVKPIDLHHGLFVSEGFTASQYVMTALVFGVPIGVLYAFGYFGYWHVGLYVLAAMGLVGLIASKTLVTFISKVFGKRR